MLWCYKTQCCHNHFCSILANTKRIFHLPPQLRPPGSLGLAVTSLARCWANSCLALISISAPLSKSKGYPKASFFNMNGTLLPTSQISLIATVINNLPSKVLQTLFLDVFPQWWSVPTVPVPWHVLWLMMDGRLSLTSAPPSSRCPEIHSKKKYAKPIPYDRVVTNVVWTTDTPIKNLPNYGTLHH